MKKSINHWKKQPTRYFPAAIALVVFGLLGSYLLFQSNAATPTASSQAESGTTSSTTNKVTDTTASGSGAIKFGNGTVTTGTRDRARVVNNTLVSDQGTLLRGGTLWFVPEAAGQFRWATGTSSWPIFTQYHLNTVRLAMEYGPSDANHDSLNMADTLADLDAAIAQATSHRMYAVIDEHWGAGEHDQASAVTFWQTVAARYKDNTNVIFELLNEPVGWNPKDYKAQDIADENQLYGIVHAAAPQTPVITMSFAIPENDDNNSSPTMTDQVNKLTGVDWTNTAVGFHGYWVPNTNGEVQLKQHYPTINTEFQTPCTQSGLPEDVCEGDNYMEQTMERLGISWLCWDCNDTSSNSNLAAMEADAITKGYWWDADN